MNCYIFPNVNTNKSNYKVLSLNDPLLNLPCEMCFYIHCISAKYIVTFCTFK